MRYVILNRNISANEKSDRKKYIEKVTNLYFLPHKISGGIEFCSVPRTSIDCLFIVGHNFNVKHYLITHSISEKNIVIVSCGFSLNDIETEGKKIYSSHDDNGQTSYYDGKEWNLDFLVSKEELKIINSSGDFMERVEKIFRRVL